MKYNVFDYIVLTLVIWRFVMKVLNCVALTIAIIGAINWGLIGFFRFDLVNVIFGNMSILSRIIYALIGVSGLYSISFYLRNQDM